MTRAEAWRPVQETSKVVLEMAAGRTFEGRFGPSLVGLLTHHGLVGVAVHSDQPDIRRLTQPSFARLAARQKVMKTHLKKLLESFAEERLRVAVLKGPAIAMRYDLAEARTFTDLDLLIPRSELNRGLELLKRVAGNEGLPPQEPKADKRLVPIVDRQSNVRFSVDLHWDAFSYRQLMGVAKYATSEAWERATFVTDSLGPRWELPIEAETAFLCAHSILDHRFRLILFRDLAELTRGAQFWDALVAFARRHGLRSTTYLACLIAANTLDAKVAEDVLNELRPRGIALAVSERLLPSTDLVTFDGHRAHPLNLAMVLVHDEPRNRSRLALRAPTASLHWRRRVRSQPKPKRRSLVILVASTQRRGAEVFCELLTEAMIRRGWDAELVALAKGQGPDIAAQVLSPTATLGKLDLATAWRLRRYLKDHRPEVLLAFGSSTLKYAVAAQTTLRGRPAVAYTSIGEPLYWARSRRQITLYRELLRRVDLVLTVSARTGQQLIGSLSVPVAKVRQTPIGVPETLLDLSPAKRGDALRILFVGSLSMEKDPLAALEILAKLRPAHRAELRMLGTGPLAAAVRDRVRSLDLDGQVELQGGVEDVSPHLAWADVLLLTSATEGLPAVVLEAAAAGIPSVAYDVGGVGEVVVDHVTGRLIAPGSISSATEALTEYARDPATARREGSAGRELVRASYTIKQSACGFDSALSELIQ